MILISPVAEHAEVFVEIGEAFQVVGVVDVGAVGIGTDEAIAGGDRSEVLGVRDDHVVLGVAARLRLAEHEPVART